MRNTNKAKGQIRYQAKVNKYVLFIIKVSHISNVNVKYE